jgi:hypothetical protein
MKKNPPNREFKILQPHKMEALDLKNPMATRAVDHTKDRRAKLEAEDSLNDLAQKDESFDTDEERAHRAFSKDVTQTKDGMSADELDNFMQSLRDVSASPVERHVAGSYRTHAPESRRSCAFLDPQTSRHILLRRVVDASTFLTDRRTLRALQIHADPVLARDRLGPRPAVQAWTVLGPQQAEVHAQVVQRDDLCERLLHAGEGGLHVASRGPRQPRAGRQLESLTNRTAGHCTEEV